MRTVLQIHMDIRCPCEKFFEKYFIGEIVSKHLEISPLQRRIPLKSKTLVWEAKDEGATVTPLTQMLNSTRQRMRTYVIFRCLTFRLK
jgi:hypothetical protein